MTLTEIISEITKYDGMSFFESVSIEEIELFEHLNNIKLPIGYKEWLQFSDGGELFLPAGIQLYGINQTPIIDVNDIAKPSDNYIVIGALASGDTILANRHSEEIAIYNLMDERIESDEIYNNFKSFLKDLQNVLCEK